MGDSTALVLVSDHLILPLTWEGYTGQTSSGSP